MNSTAEDIRDIIEYYIDSSSDIDLFEVSIGKEPSEPQNVISIFETPGFPSQLTFERLERYDYPSVQIRIRCTDYQSGYEQGNEIKNTLHGRAGETWNGVYYSLIRCINGPNLLDYDKNQRPRFVLNFDVQRREV